MAYFEKQMLHFGIILDLQQICKDSSEVLYIFTQLPLNVNVYVTLA